METTSKNLIIFDFDNTILSEDSNHKIFELLSDESQEEEKGLEYNNWAHHIQHVYNLMKKEGVEISQIKNIIEKIEFNEGFHDLFTLIRENKDKFDCIIVSQVQIIWPYNGFLKSMACMIYSVAVIQISQN
jgi:2-hydroxy-3-keto-5-methylthiopentenyl-1-phosphate phosphatase